MKKLLPRLSVLLLAFVPAFADVQWPPPPYEMPRTVLDGSSLDGMFASLKTTISSLSNTGLLIFGVVASVGLIASVITHTTTKK